LIKEEERKDMKAIHSIDERRGSTWRLAREGGVEVTGATWRWQAIMP
jgi:hypothetical protein